MNHPNRKKNRRGYRLNRKKFAGVLFAVGFTVITILIAVKMYDEAAAGAVGELGGDGIGAVAVGSGVPEKTQSPEKTLPGTTPETTESTKSPGELLIVVDAGHGGFDPGAEGADGTYESSLNLEVAECLKGKIEDMGAKVIMTRESDEDGLGNTQQESLQERRRIIEQSGADMVISIHMNSFGDRKVSGPLVLFAPGSQQGKEFADIVQQCLNEELEAQGTARSESLVVVESTDKPSILVECGFITNAGEEKNLKKPEYQSKIAEAICKGISGYISGGNKKD